MRTRTDPGAARAGAASPARALALLFFGLAAALAGGGDAAAQSAAKAQADPELVNRIKAEVLRELRESGALEREIDRGVERYVARQRAAAAQREEQTAANRAAKVRPVSKTRDHIRGNPDAPVSLIEYSDFECPFCKRFHPTAKQIVEVYGGKVNWVYRHFPLDFHNPAAQREAEASECAAELGGNDAFWRYTDLVYERTASNGKGVPEGELPAMAASIGLDRAKFDACLKSGRKTARVKEDLEEGIAIGISGTPGNVLRNNRSGAVTTLHGAQPIERFRQALDGLLR
ncbi:MAG: DsbA family protein [Burkholderiales bacterium]|nr:DsbA family protein [Burkholderiales bacterium]